MTCHTTMLNCINSVRPLNQEFEKFRQEVSIVKVYYFWFREDEESRGVILTVDMIAYVLTLGRRHEISR